MTINGTGTQRILNESFKYTPDYIYINNVLQTTNNINVYLNEQINNITIIFNQQITDCSYMFNYLSNIIYSDLSLFDTKLVINMLGMFEKCYKNSDNYYFTSKGYSLISLNLNNLDTSNVIDMGIMFCGCNSLISLNLNNFYTSMVTNMYDMFYYCNSLISLNLNNFDTSKVTNMRDMFKECNTNLIISLLKRKQLLIFTFYTNNKNFFVFIFYCVKLCSQHLIL